MHLATYVGLQREASRTLSESFREVAASHGDEPDVAITCATLASACDRHVLRLDPVVDRYGEHREPEPERLHAQGLASGRAGGVGLLRDLQDLYVLASFVDITWTVLTQAAQALRDQQLLEIVGECDGDTRQQLLFLRTRIKQAAPQALVVGHAGT